MNIIIYSDNNFFIEGMKKLASNAISISGVTDVPLRIIDTVTTPQALARYYYAAEILRGNEVIIYCSQCIDYFPSFKGFRINESLSSSDVEMVVYHFLAWKKQRVKGSLLTQREFEIAKLISMGTSVSRIAVISGKSEKKVYNCVAQLKRKLHLPHISHLRFLLNRYFGDSELTRTLTEK